VQSTRVPRHYLSTLEKGLTFQALVQGGFSSKWTTSGLAVTHSEP
jgi:hypothetical protein